MAPRIFTVAERDRAREHILAKARSDSRIIAGAAVGSDAIGVADRWSDIDLTFGLSADFTALVVLADWTRDLEHELGAVHLFDVADRATVYRALLLPGNLQVDLSFTPEFAAEYGPKFRLLFGDSVKRDYAAPTSAKHVFGVGVHHALRARYCIQRDRGWQAEYWISGVRDQALSLSCLRRGLEMPSGRGFDRLPVEVLRLAEAALVASVEHAELIRALRCAIDLLIREAEEVRDFTARLEPQLRDLASSEWPRS